MYWGLVVWGRKKRDLGPISLDRIKLERQRREGIDRAGGRSNATSVLWRLGQQNCIKTHKNVIPNVRFITID